MKAPKEENKKTFAYAVYSSFRVASNLFATS